VAQYFDDAATMTPALEQGAGKESPECRKSSLGNKNVLMVHRRRLAWVTKSPVCFINSKNIFFIKDQKKKNHHLCVIQAVK